MSDTLHERQPAMETRYANGKASDQNGHSVREADAGAAAAKAPEAVLANVRGLVPLLRERMRETEELRQLPDTTIVDAAQTGMFSLMLPRSLGGSGGDLRHFVELSRILAQGHLAAAWTLSFLTQHNYMLARFPAKTQQEVFHDGRYALMAGVISPTGKATATDGGFLLSGVWAYATGIMHSDWVMLFGMIEEENRGCVFVLPRADVEVEDTWRMSGMGGTGSHHVKVQNRFVPAHRVLSLEHWTSRNNAGAGVHREAIYSYALLDVIGFIFPAMAVGAAEAMLEEYRQRVETRRAPFSPQFTADTVPGQMRYARSLSSLQTAQALLEQTLRQTIEANEQANDELSLDLRARLKLGLLSVPRLAWESIELILRGSGTSVFKSDSPTQFYVRDMEMLLSHVTIDEDTMLHKTGEILLGRADATITGVI